MGRGIARGRRAAAWARGPLPSSGASSGSAGRVAVGFLGTLPLAARRSAKTAGVRVLGQLRRCLALCREAIELSAIGYSESRSRPRPRRRVATSVRDGFLSARERRDRHDGRQVLQVRSTCAPGARTSMSRKRTRWGPIAAAAAPAIQGAEQVAFAFKAALHSKDREDPCRLSGELCVWMRPATGGNLRRTLISGSSITGRVTSSREPGHLAQLISGRISGDREQDERGRFIGDSRQLHLSLCGLEVSVGLRELHTWEQGEGGKLVLSNSGTGDLFFADEIAILFTTLSASRPSEQTGKALPAATAAAKPRRSARLTTTAPNVPAAPAALKS